MFLQMLYFIMKKLTQYIYLTAKNSKYFKRFWTG
jgi:hypothetical protein